MTLRIFRHRPLSPWALHRGMRPAFLGTHYWMLPRAPRELSWEAFKRRPMKGRVSFYRKGPTMIRVWNVTRGGQATRAHVRQARKANRRAELAARRREAAYIAAHGFGL